MPRIYYVYILANRSKTIYIGVTNDLHRRLFVHKSKLIAGFTKKYDINQLVYVETTSDIKSALSREKELKAWRREKKIALIESTNPGWRDLSLDWANGSSD